MGIQEENRLHRFVRDRIKETRKKKKMTQEALAAKSGLDRVSIGYIEQGKRKPTLYTISRIAHALDVPLKKLIP